MTTNINFEVLTDEELNKLVDDLGDILDSVSASTQKWKDTYSVYLEATEEQDHRYRKAHQKSFDKFYNERIKGKTWETIDQDDWSFYSDWHKDMYGFRPRTI